MRLTWDDGRSNMTERTISEEDERAFFSGTRSEKMPFVLNDTVRLKNGEKRGASAWVVRARSTSPDTRYLLEFCSSEGDLEVSASEIVFEES